MKLLMRHLGLTQQELADVIQVHRGTIAAYISRENASPSTEKVRIIASAYNVPLEWFYDGKDSLPPDAIEVAKKRSMDPSERRMVTGTIAVPVWTAGAGYSNDDDWSFEETDSREEVPLWLCGDDPPNVRLIRVLGYSMGRRIPYGSRVLAHLQPEVLPHDLGVFQSPSMRLYVKVFEIDAGRPQLQSLEDAIPAIVAPDVTGWLTRAGIIAIVRPYEDEESNIEYNGGRVLKSRRRSTEGTA